MSVLEFEKIRNANLLQGKFKYWSALYGWGMQRLYHGDQIRVIYVPPSTGKKRNHEEMLFIRWDDVKIDFSVASEQGVIGISDHSDFYFQNRLSKAEFVAKVQDIVKILLQ